jgi:hypothetical protein
VNFFSFERKFGNKMLKYTPTKAKAQAGGFGFQKSQARPKSDSGQAQVVMCKGFKNPRGFTQGYGG